MNSSLALDAFTVTAEYGRSHTTFLVHAEGQREPAARMHRDAAYDGLRPYEVRTGPEFSEIAGYVNDFKAFTPERAELGSVAHKQRTTGPDSWTFTQHGLGELTGLPEGAGAKVRHGSLLRMAFDATRTNAVLSHRLRFSSPASPASEGFAFVRHTGIRARYSVEVHDPRVDRLLVLACIAHYNRFVAADPRQFTSTLTANPFKN
ncbi:hypothetical protein A6A06_22255 [Streptomyces sp. CB02923]|uniref:hypothetical protein n=1 Tax=Streptomyces sp. CB02923 TaxID=1718985 RepID=UPI000938B681|nr:hypothetical protein [Streptomyces sp. CB02923]OKH99798.1 hypothetical protein A6A06_22255 [Streptomyces sp. CB02923]